MDRKKFFRYGEKEITYLKSKDKKLGAVIEAVGPIRKELDEDLFSSVAHHIVGQQISCKALANIWGRLLEALGTVTPSAILKAGEERLRICGMSLRKAEYISDLARKTETGEFRPDSVKEMTDEEAIAAMTALKGVGRWTAEMILLFSLERPDILSYDDLGIRRGMRMVYRHRDLSRQQFEKYRRRLSPYGSVASLYFWAVSDGALPGVTDPGEKRRSKKS